MRRYFQLSVWVLVVSGLLTWGPSPADATTKASEIRALLQEIVQVGERVSNKGLAMELWPDIVLAQVQMGRLTDSLTSYQHWVSIVNPLTIHAAPMDSTGRYWHFGQVGLLSKMGRLAMQMGHHDWGQERFDGAWQLIDRAPQPWDRVAGYRMMIEALYPLGLAVDDLLQPMRGELERWPEMGFDSEERSHGPSLLLNALDVELLVKDEEGIRRTLKKIFKIIYPPDKRYNTYLLRKTAIRQAKLGQHEEARDNMKAVYNLRKPFENIDFDKWEPEARYIWDLCDLAKAEIEQGAHARAQETLRLAQTMLLQFPHQLPIFQIAWQYLAISSAKSGNDSLRQEAESHLVGEQFQHSSLPEWIRFLFNAGNTEEALHLLATHPIELDDIVTDLFKRQDFSTILNLPLSPNHCCNEDVGRKFAFAVTHEKGIEEGRRWVSMLPTDFLKIYGLLGVLDWMLEQEGRNLFPPTLPMFRHTSRWPYLWGKALRPLPEWPAILLWSDRVLCRRAPHSFP